MHAEDDLRCPMEQAEQLFIALKKQRKDVMFVRFPDENHEMSRAGKPRHRLERFRLHSRSGLPSILGYNDRFTGYDKLS